MNKKVVVSRPTQHSNFRSGDYNKEFYLVTQKKDLKDGWSIYLFQRSSDFGRGELHCLFLEHRALNEIDIDLKRGAPAMGRERQAEDWKEKTCLLHTLRTTPNK